MHHPHLHVVIPGGGLAPDGSKWVACKRSRHGKDFFLPVRILSRVFRSKFLAGLKQAYAQGRLGFHEQLQELWTPPRFEQLLNRAVRIDWVVYAKQPFGGPRQVLKYLARYTHRVAISNQRLLRLENGCVTFRYKDYADDQQAKTMTLEATEFLRRFLLHVLPRGLVRIRHYGLLSNRDRTAKLNQCRELLNERGESAPNHPETPDASENEAVAKLPCPKCATGRLMIIELVPATMRSSVRRPHFFSERTRHLEFANTS